MKPISVIFDRILCKNTIICRYPKRGPYLPAGSIVQSPVTRVLVGGRIPATVGSKAICGGSTWLTSGSTRVLLEGKPVHRVGDRNGCSGVTIGPGDLRVLVG
jgi:uncharacterized Zn-binding protein involved in type VI secretion